MRSALLTTDQDTIYDDIKALFTEDEIKHLLAGAHFILQDQGLYYLKWIGVGKPRAYGSSHNALTEQYSVYGDKLGECLFATRKYNNELCTWVQCERYSHSLPHLIPHGVCFLHYRWTGQNIGPQGTSAHTENNPLIIPKNRIRPGVVLRCDGV